MKKLLAQSGFCFMLCVTFCHTDVRRKLYKEKATWVNARNKCLPHQLTTFFKSDINITIGKSHAAWINAQEYDPEINGLTDVARIEYRSPDEKFGYYANGNMISGDGAILTWDDFLNKSRSNALVAIGNITAIIRLLHNTETFWINIENIASSPQTKCLAVVQDDDNNFVRVADDCNSQHFFICDKDYTEKEFRPTIQKILNKTRQHIIDRDHIDVSINKAMKIVAPVGAIVVIVLVSICVAFMVKRKRRCSGKHAQTDIRDTHDMQASKQLPQPYSVTVVPVDTMLNDKPCAYSYVMANQLRTNDDHSYDVVFQQADKNVTGNTYNHIMVHSDEDGYDKTTWHHPQYLCADAYSTITPRCYMPASETEL